MARLQLGTMTYMTFIPTLKAHFTLKTATSHLVGGCERYRADGTSLLASELDEQLTDETGSKGQRQGKEGLKRYLIDKEKDKDKENQSPVAKRF